MLQNLLCHFSVRLGWESHQLAACDPLRLRLRLVRAILVPIEVLEPAIALCAVGPLMHVRRGAVTRRVDCGTKCA